MKIFDKTVSSALAALAAVILTVPPVAAQPAPHRAPAAVPPVSSAPATAPLKGPSFESGGLKATVVSASAS